MSHQRRVVLLGASNLTRGLSTAVEASRLRWGRPLEMLIAAGHGRSYGLTSRVLARTLPSILACGLWDELAQRATMPTAALITDIGSDLLYGAATAESSLVRRTPAARSARVRAARWHRALAVLSRDRARTFCGKDVQIALA